MRFFTLILMIAFLQIAEGSTNFQNCEHESPFGDSLQALDTLQAGTEFISHTRTCGYSVTYEGLARDYKIRVVAMLDDAKGKLAAVHRHLLKADSDAKISKIQAKMAAKDMWDAISAVSPVLGFVNTARALGKTPGAVSKMDVVMAFPNLKETYETFNGIVGSSSNGNTTVGQLNNLVSKLEELIISEKEKITRGNQVPAIECQLRKREGIPARDCPKLLFPLPGKKKLCNFMNSSNAYKSKINNFAGSFLRRIANSIQDPSSWLGTKEDTTARMEFKAIYRDDADSKAVGDKTHYWDQNFTSFSEDQVFCGLYNVDSKLKGKDSVSIQTLGFPSVIELRVKSTHLFKRTRDAGGYYSTLRIERDANGKVKRIAVRKRNGGLGEVMGRNMNRLYQTYQDFTPSKETKIKALRIYNEVSTEFDLINMKELVKDHKCSRR